MDTSGLVEQVAQVLQQHPDQLRIKKLAFGVCEKRWENDPAVLNRRDFISLINRLLATYRCADDLRQAVLKVVARLNRQTRYLPLAYFFLDQVESLYHASAADEDMEMTQFGEFPVEEPTHLDAATATAGTPAAGRVSMEDEETAFSLSAPVGSEEAERTAGRVAIATHSTHAATTSELTINAQPAPAAVATSRQAAGMMEACLSPYAAVARNLERHTEAHRIHKLIYGVCHQTWENDMLRLQSHPLLDLLELLHQKAPSLAYLAVMLNQKAATLNRKLVYMQVAHVICELMRPVYSDGLIPAPATAPPGAGAIAAPIPTAQSTASRTQTAFSEEAAIADDMTTPIAPISDPMMQADSGWDAIVEGVTQAEWEPAMNCLNRHEMTMPEIPSELLAEGLQEQPYSGYDMGAGSAADEDAQAIRDRSDLFELRLYIIRYANPLRAKLILFSSLYHTFDFSSQDWLLLKDATLEDLLRKLFETYHNMDEVDVNLTRAAYAMPNIDPQDATVASLMRAIAPYYPADSSVNVA